MAAIVDGKLTAQLGPLTSSFANAVVIQNFAILHFKAAKHFAAKVKEVEQANAEKAFGTFWDEIAVYCPSCIITAAASVECLINELYLAPGPLHAAPANFDIFFFGDPNDPKSRGFQMERVLDKYTEAAKLLGAKAVPKNSDAYKNADALIRFRNYLIHFKPLWDKGRANVDLEAALAGKFALTPFLGPDNPFLERRCMSAGCAVWAVRAAAEFIAAFAQRTGLSPAHLGAFKA